MTEVGNPCRLNELEWVEGEIWANIYQTDRIVVIDATSGEVRASIDLSGLLPLVQRKPDTSVLNGTARDLADGAIWVTGKRWPWLYRIELVLLNEFSLTRIAKNLIVLAGRIAVNVAKLPELLGAE